MIEPASWWTFLAALWADRRIDPAAKVCYARLLALPCDPSGEVTIEAVNLARDLGRSDRTQQKWIPDLEEAGYLEVIEWQPWPGKWRLRLHRPGGEGDQTAVDGIAEEPERERQARHQVPSGVGQVPRADRQAEPLVCCPLLLQLLGQGCSRARETCGETPTSHDRPAPAVQQHPPRAERRPAPAPPGCDSPARNGRPLDAQRNGRSETDPLRMDTEVIAAAIARRCDDPDDRARRKAQLVATMQKLVGDPKTHPSIFARIADAIVAGKVDEVEIMAVGEATARKRREGTIGNSPGAYFLSRARRVCGSALWPCHRETAPEAIT